MDTLLDALFGPFGLTVGALIVVRQLFVLFIKEREASRMAFQDQQAYLTKESDHNRKAFMDVLELLKAELAACNEHRDECTKQITFLTEKCARLQERVDQLEKPLRNILAEMAVTPKKKSRRG